MTRAARRTRGRTPARRRLRTSQAARPPSATAPRAPTGTSSHAAEIRCLACIAVAPFGVASCGEKTGRCRPEERLGIEGVHLPGAADPRQLDPERDRRLLRPRAAAGTGRGRRRRRRRRSSATCRSGRRATGTGRPGSRRAATPAVSSSHGSAGRTASTRAGCPPLERRRDVARQDAADRVALGRSEPGRGSGGRGEEERGEKREQRDTEGHAPSVTANGSALVARPRAAMFAPREHRAPTATPGRRRDRPAASGRMKRWIGGCRTTSSSSSRENSRCPRTAASARRDRSSAARPGRSRR